MLFYLVQKIGYLLDLARVRTSPQPWIWETAATAGDYWPDATPPLQPWLRMPETATVKSNPSRRIYRVPLPRGTVYVKECRVHGLRGWLRELLRPPKARLEYVNALELRRRGLPAVEPLAWCGVRRLWPGTSYLITRAVDDAVTLQEFLTHRYPRLPAVQQRLLRRQLAVYLGILLARLHENGVIHLDLHPGNLLVQYKPDTLRLVLIDLHAVRFAKLLGWKQSLENLAVFNRWFQLRTWRTDRLRFWQAYCQHRAGWSDLPEQERRRRQIFLEAATQQANIRLWTSRLRRCLHAGRHFQPIATASCHGLAAADWPLETIAGLVQATEEGSPASLEQFLQQYPHKILKRSPSGLVAAVALHGPAAALDPASPRWVVIKQFRCKRWWDPLRNLFRRSPAWRAWLHAHAVQDRGLRTPRPLAVWHRYLWGLPTDGYLLTEFLPDSQPLHRLPYSQLARLLLPLAAFVRTLHDRGLSHRDLKPDNLLATPDGQLYLVDLAGMRRCKHVSKRRRIKDLARLNVGLLLHPSLSRSQRLRFLLHYLGLPPALVRRGNSRSRQPVVWKVWWRAIERRSRRKWSIFQRKYLLHNMLDRKRSGQADNRPENHE